MTRNAKRVARLAVLTALGVVFLFFASVMPSGKIALTVLASFGACVTLMMYGCGWALAVFGITALLGWLILPGDGVILYAAFFGYYPIVKSLFERIHSKVLSWLCKYALYVAVCLIYLLLAQSVLGYDGKEIGWYILFSVGAVVFWLYDRCFSLFIAFYIERIARYFL